MKLYRINQLTEPGGAVVKKKDVLAASDKDAVQRAADSEELPSARRSKGRAVGRNDNLGLVVLALSAVTEQHLVRFSDQAARSAIDPKGFVWIVVGDAARLKPQLAKLGMPIEEVEAP